MYIGLHVKCPLFLPDFNKILIFSTDFRNLIKFRFQENPFSGSRVVPCGQTDVQTDMTKLIVHFSYFANVPKTVLK